MTPLAKYLQENTTDTAANIGRRMAETMEEGPSSASLSQWVTGATAPSAMAQIAMERATGGKVTPLDWVNWKVARAKS